MTSQYKHLCQKCRKILSIDFFDVKSDGEHYSTCKSCRLKNNQDSKDSYNRNKHRFECPECKKDYSTKTVLKRHLWSIHSIGKGEIYICSEECDYTTKSKGNLKKHLWEIHGVGDGKYFPCTEKNCDFTCKSKVVLKRHFWHIHNVGKGTYFSCIEENCKYSCKSKGNLTRHLWAFHSLGNGTYFPCTEEDCNFTCKSNGDLKKHLWAVHSLGNGKIFQCSECGYTCKRNNHLKTHLSNVHDIGDKTCEICAKNVYALTPYHDTKVNKTVKVCRICYKKYTEFSTRKEEQMVKFLKKEIPYIVLEDKIIRGDACATLRRPDLLIASTTDLHIVVECDENQHRGYNPRCEDGRYDEIIDEIKTGKVRFIRWNPDYCKKDGKRFSVSRQKRLELLRDLILKICLQVDGDDPYKIYYMFYTEDNEVITKRFPKKMVYVQKDF